MLHEFLNHREGNGCNVSSGTPCFYKVQRMSDRSNNYLRFNPVVIIDQPYITHQINAFPGNIVNSSHERRNVCCSCLSHKKSLRRGKAEG